MSQVKNKMVTKQHKKKKLEEQGLVGFIETKKGIGYGLKHA
ncbi:DNA-binding response regulator [Streptococcus pneumoniae]|nr:DNA-binding response regulator [Streptococcus pneumoniae]